MRGKPLLSFEGRILGKMIRRPNRFLAIVKVGENEIKAHVHDPGRLNELLFPGNDVLVIKREGRGRKTSYDLIGAKRGNEWAFIHSGYHSKIAEELLRREGIPSLKGYKIKRREVRVGKSRIDFELIPYSFLEVKGCTLIRDNFALFPDAPTERGRRHILELEKKLSEGVPCFLLFLVFGHAEKFSPNWKTDPKFSEELMRASKMGLNVIAFSIEFDSVNIFPGEEIEVYIRNG